MTTPVNVNVGVLGHVDSGKTNLVRVLSTQLSTAALDKHPQSQQRGITLDLGFSALRLPVCTANAAAAAVAAFNHPTADNTVSIDNARTQEMQITLVDCPGHASLFKTILGGAARIIDAVLLVVDVTKGLQPQTIESLVVADLAVAAQRQCGVVVVVALNKIDLLPPRERTVRIDKAKRAIRSFLQRHFPHLCSRTNRRVPIVPIAAAPSAVSGLEADDTTERPVVPLGITDLLTTLQKHLQVPQRDTSGPLSIAIDHCFAISGSGTILTGTVLSGVVHVGDALELPHLQIVTTVKSLQVFRTSVTRAAQGDRVGIRVNGLDATRVERSVAIAPHTQTFVTQVIVPVTQTALFGRVQCKSGARVHATIGHATVVATATFFVRMGGGEGSHSSSSNSPNSNATDASTNDQHAFDALALYEHVATLEPLEQRETEDMDIANTDTTTAAAAPVRQLQYFALLQLEQPVLCPRDALVVCSRLDLDPKRCACRIAFHGRVAAAVVTDTSDSATATSAAVVDNSSTRLNGWNNAPPSMPLSALCIGRIKTRDGVVDKVVVRQQQQSTTAANDSTGTGGTWEVIGRDLFAKDVDWRVFSGVRVLFPATFALGRVIGPFGKAGKFRIASVRSNSTAPVAGDRIVLRFVKLSQLRVVGAAAVRAAAGGKKATSARPTAKVAKNVLQDDDALLYPEAFVYTRSDRNSTNATDSMEMSAPTASVAAAAPFVRSSSHQLQQQQQQQQHNILQLMPRGHIERLKGETTPDGRNPLAIVAGLFVSDTDAALAVGRRVVVVLQQQRLCPTSSPSSTDALDTSDAISSSTTSSNSEVPSDVGVIDKPFGKAGKVRVVFAVDGGTRAQEGDAVALCD